MSDDNAKIKRLLNWHVSNSPASEQEVHARREAAMARERAKKRESHAENPSDTEGQVDSSAVPLDELAGPTSYRPTNRRTVPRGVKKPESRVEMYIDDATREQHTASLSDLLHELTDSYIQISSESERVSVKANGHGELLALRIEPDALQSRAGIKKIEREIVQIVNAVDDRVEVLERELRIKFAIDAEDLRHGARSKRENSRTDFPVQTGRSRSATSSD